MSHGVPAPVSDWDVIVVGAGPAGTSTALSVIHAGPGLRVLLLDRADFPRDKSCGDGIAPHVFDRLGRIGVTGIEEGWTPLTRLELARGSSSVARPMARPVYVIPREVFDARLVERAVAAGATLVRHRVTDVRATAEGIVLDGRYRAPVVVGADGAHSVLRGHLGLRDGRRALAIRGYAPTPSERRGTQVIRYGDRRQPSYAWAFDRGDGLSNVGYGELLPSDRTDDPPSRALLLDQLDRLLPGSVAAGDQWKAHHLPLSGWSWEQPDGPVLLTGDAAGLINPMTGEGIYYAVATGITAGRAAAQAFRAGNPARAGELHRRAVRALLGRHLKHTWTAARLAESATLVEGGIRAARRDARVFDELVELGLGDGRISRHLVGHLITGVARRTVPRTPLTRLAKGP
ncbi:NAD(P)/FAD-dependent oxidoreductase [Nocardioides sp.]|uniref:NAD(P)/FAD-dependent oxidoreductase n=1 Tax=Nocardioides sp. TaxID=35761 RepID=UPI001A21AD42|nr:NAD(P)/FAD-dependent oxidoreductase [Nocardioides sp.]MBJ7357079.1 NAD(P)/FAD-dependent oxidoreductase [Nocardioides sp.]